MAELNLQAIKEIQRQTTGLIQANKLRASANAIRYQQQKGNMPADKADITSYVTSTNPKNRFVDIDRFRRVMKARPDKYWQSKFIFLSSEIDTYETIAEAADIATKEVIARTPQGTKAGRPGRSVGHLKRSVTTYVDGVEVINTKKAIMDAGDSAPIFELTNIADYGSTAEARAYFSAMGGIIYYVAKRMQTRYPQLGILFYYAKAQAFGLTHVYDVPVLRISSPAKATGAWSRPGVRGRTRLKSIRRINRVFK